MSSLSVKKTMWENQVKQLTKTEQESVKVLTEDFKKMLSYGKIHRIAFELAQIELEIERQEAE